MRQWVSIVLSFIKEDIFIVANLLQSNDYIAFFVLDSPIIAVLMAVLYEKKSVWAEGRDNLLTVELALLDK